MEYKYHWKDKIGKEHYTDNYDEADKAVHEGNFVMVVMLDKHRKDGSSRAGM